MTKEIPTIEINMDKECGQCHEMGTTPSGLCVKCVANIFDSRAIGYNAIHRAKIELCAMLDEYAEEIDKAYIKASNDLTIALGLKLTPTRLAGEVELVASINFVESRIKHAVKVLIDSEQRKLPGVE